MSPLTLCHGIRGHSKTTYLDQILPNSVLHFYPFFPLTIINKYPPTLPFTPYLHFYQNLEKVLPTLLLIFKKIFQLHYHSDLHSYLFSRIFPSYTIIRAYSCIQNSIYSCNTITTTLIQISRLFYFGFFSKTNNQMII